MLTFLDDIRAMPVPGEAGWTPALLSAGVVRAEEELISARFLDPAEPFPAETLESLLAFASWLEAIASSELVEDLDVSQASYVAGGIRELLFQLRGDWAERDEVLGLSLLLRSSSHPFFGIHLAKGEEPHARTNVQRLFSVLIDFARGDHFQVVERAPHSIARLADVDPLSVREVDLARLSMYRTLAEASFQVSSAVLFGEVEEARRAAQATVEWVRESGRYFPEGLVQLANRWSSAAGALLDRSSPELLRDAGVDQAYIDLLVSTGIIEFWPQQAEALRAGLLSGRSVVVSLPTGSGKTLLGELVFAERLRSGVDAWGCYVAPSRALVHQSARDLAARLAGIGIHVRTVMAGAEDGAALEAELDSLATPRTITVATQERLDAYYRSDPARFQSMSVLVVDEAQQLADAERGVLLEQLISKIKAQVSDCKIVLLSATSSNSEELASWLGGISYEAASRVNRQQLAVAARVKEEPQVIRAWNHNGERRRRVSVNGALVTGGSLSLARPGEGVQACAYGAFKAEVQQRFQAGQWHEMDGGTSSTEHATALARRLHTRAESTIVFCATQASARTQAIELADSVEELTGEQLDDLVRALSSLVGEDHALVSCAKKGIGFHHASLPPTILRLVEYGFRNSLLRTLFATSTLREGVNLPASNVIVAGEMRPQGQRSAPMKVSDFVNLAGRAGRPQYDREGLAVLVPNKLPNALTNANRYILYGPDELAVRSAMETLLDYLAGFTDTPVFESLETPLQSILLSLYSSGVDEEASIEAFLEATLARSQLDFDLTAVTATLASEFRRVEANSGSERLKSMAKTGLSLLGNDAIFNFAESSAALLAGHSQDTEYSEVVSNIALQCVLACRYVPDIRRGKLESDELWNEDVLAPILDGWIRGVPYIELSRLAPFNRSARPVEEAVDTLADLSQWLPWPLGALQEAMKVQGLEPDPLIGFLPLYVRFGVPSRIAAFLSLAGIFDREAALEYSRDARLQDAGFREVADWALQELPELQTAHDLIRSVLQQRRARSRFAHIRVTSDDVDLQPGIQLRIVREQETITAEIGDQTYSLHLSQRTDLPRGRRLLGRVTGVSGHDSEIRVLV